MSFDDQIILLRSPITPGSGYGADGIALARHLEDAGAQVHLDPSVVGVPLPMQVAKMLARPRPARFDMVLQHADPASFGMPMGLIGVRTRLLWTMWEFGGVAGEEWEPTLAERLSGFTHILSYTEQATAVYGPYAPHARLGTIQGGYDADLWKPDPAKDPVRDWDSTFRFGMVLTNSRKQPFVAIEAFQKLKEKHGDHFDAELHLKQNAWVVPPMAHDPENGVHLHSEPWTHEQMRSFYCELNCLLCPSWGEGKQLPALEAMTLGCPVIASDCSGHMQWASPAHTYIIHGEVRERDPVRLPGQTAVFVAPDDLAELMWHVYLNRHEARMMGETASRVIPQTCNWSKVIERLDFWLNES